MLRLSKLSILFLAAILVAGSCGCGGAAKARQQLEKTLERSAVVFICLRENNQHVVKKILKSEPSWGSNIKIGDTVELPTRNDPKDAGVLVTREFSQWADNGQLAQGAIPFDQSGRLLLGRMTLKEVEEFLALSPKSKKN